MTLWARLGRITTQLVARCEEVPITLGGWLLSFSALVFVRNFLEGISQRQLNVLDADNLPFLAHATAFYFVMFGGMVLGLSFLTKERIARVSRFVLCVACIIVVPPLFDLVATHGVGATMAYRSISETPSLMALVDFSFWSPFGIFFLPGLPGSNADLQMNFGIRLEVMLIFITLLWYVYMKTRHPGRVLGLVAMLYGGLYAVSVLPAFFVGPGPAALRPLFFVQPAAWFPVIRGANLALFVVYALLFLWIIAAWARQAAPRHFRAAWQNIRPDRLVVNIALFVSGLALGLGRVPNLPAPRFFDWLVIALGIAGVVLRWVWAVSRNDLADEHGDRVTMPDRPLVQGRLTRAEMSELAWYVGLLALVISLALGFRFFFLTILWAALAYCYSEQPLRLKRFPIISNLVLGGAHLTTLLTGFVLVGGMYLADFPARLAVLFLVGAAFGAEFKNIKDVAGDRQDGVMTIPNIFPGPTGRRLVGLMGTLVFLAVPLTYPAAASLLLPIALFFAAIYYYAATRTPYREALIFVAYGGFSVAVVALVISGALIL